MNFLNPTTDIAFKKLFGNAQHADILISFLNSILKRKPGEEIVDVVFNNPNYVPNLPDDKAVIIDVLCTDQMGKKYVIEMQAARQNFFLERAQFYIALMLANQLKSGEEYTKLRPVIFVAILDFDLL